MAESEAAPAVFDDDVVAATATDHDVWPDRLATLLGAHQAGVEELPGVENLVYEWRKRFDGTVIERTEAACYVAPPPWVREEFGERLEAEQAEVTAIVAPDGTLLPSPAVMRGRDPRFACTNGKEYFLYPQSLFPHYEALRGWREYSQTQ